MWMSVEAKKQWVCGKRERKRKICRVCVFGFSFFPSKDTEPEEKKEKMNERITLYKGRHHAHRWMSMQWKRDVTISTPSRAFASYRQRCHIQITSWFAFFLVPSFQRCRCRCYRRKTIALNRKPKFGAAFFVWFAFQIGRKHKIK